MTLLTDFSDYYDNDAIVLLEAHGVNYSRQQHSKPFMLATITNKQSSLHISGQESVQWMRSFYSQGVCSYLRMGAILFCGSVTPFVSMNLAKISACQHGSAQLEAMKCIMPSIAGDTLIYRTDDVISVLDAIYSAGGVPQCDLLEATKFVKGFFDRISSWDVNYSKVLEVFNSPVVKVALDYQIITGQESSLALVNPNLGALGFDQNYPEDVAAKLFATHALSHINELQKKAS